jgi:membrane protein involved in colicin uptake
MAKNYSELVAEAEQALQAVKDAELRRIAFQKVLEELLGGGSSGGERQVRGNRRAKRVNSKSQSQRKQASAGPINYIREMIDEGFFKKTPRTITETKVELQNHGHNLPVTSLSGPLQRLCQKKELRRHRQDGQYVYSNY